MKSNGHSPSTALAQGELFTFCNAQKSAEAQSVNSNLIPDKVKCQSYTPNKHLCIGILPFDVMQETLGISIKKHKVNEVDYYHSGKEIARWFIKKSEYNKPRPDFFV
ncbi:hypothetical protein ACQKII_20195 [Lysinibacillus sp. NPDC048646]|uniref:hypothetical protein n=1 Tax=Lysinibacillus sp. NPDC048646 TaxID=3390574 RepID=UPI003CFBD48F